MTTDGKKPRILLTGAAGCLGTAVREAAGDECELVCMDIEPGGNPSMRQGTFTDARLMREMMAGCDAVIHTASLHGAHRTTHTSAQFVEVNVGGLVTMLELCRELGVGRFVFSSTIEVFVGRLWTASGMAELDEGMTPNPDWIYPLTKLLGEQAGLYYFRNYEMEFVAFRYVAFSGKTAPGPRLLARALMPRDVAKANLIAATKPDIGYEVFNLGPETPLRREDIIAAVKDPYAVVEKHWPGAADVLRANGVELTLDHFWPVTRSDRARRVLGWRPEATFETYLRSLGWREASA